MKKNKCYHDDLLACQKKLVILELCQARVCVCGDMWICAQTHVWRYTGQVASETAAHARALGLGSTVTKESLAQ